LSCYLVSYTLKVFVKVLLGPLRIFFWLRS